MDIRFVLPSEAGQLARNVVTSFPSKTPAALLKNLEEGVVFKRGDEYMWKCRNCGHIHVGKEAPGVCPVCAHPQAYFELRGRNYE